MKKYFAITLLTISALLLTACGGGGGGSVSSGGAGIGGSIAGTDGEGNFANFIQYFDFPVGNPSNISISLTYNQGIVSPKDIRYAFDDEDWKELPEDGIVTFPGAKPISLKSPTINESAITSEISYKDLRILCLPPNNEFLPLCRIYKDVFSHMGTVNLAIWGYNFVDSPSSGYGVSNLTLRQDTNYSNTPEFLRWDISGDTVFGITFPGGSLTNQPTSDTDITAHFFLPYMTASNYTQTFQAYFPGDLSCEVLAFVYLQIPDSLNKDWATAKPSMTVTTANDGSELSLYGFDYKTAEWIEIGTANRTASEVNASCKYECALSEYYPWYCLAKPLESEKMIDVEVIFADFPSDVYNRANDFCKANKDLFTADTIYNIFGKNDSLNNGIGRIFQIWWEIKNNSKHEGELSGILGPYYEKDGREYYNLPEGIELKEGDKYSLARKNFVQALYQDVVKEPRLRSIPLPACKFSPLVWKSGKSIFPQARLISDYTGKIKFQKPADASFNLYEGKIEGSLAEHGETNLIY